MFDSTSQNQFSYKLMIDDIHDVLNSHFKFGSKLSYPNFSISKTANLLANELGWFLLRKSLYN